VRCAARRCRRAPILGVLAAVGGAVPAAAQTTVRLEIVDTAVLLAPRLDESSGAAMSTLVPGVVWTHNDSGDGPFLYATDVAGHDLGRVRVEGAHATDWEDLAAGPCHIVPGRCLYVADIGDNGRHRKHVIVYRLREPRPPESPSDTLRSVPLLDSLVLRYPDHPHDAEALAVAGDGTLLIVTKDWSGPPILFRADGGRGTSPRDLIVAGQLAMRTGLLTGRLVTGAALAPGDTVLAVRTYVSIHFFGLRHGSEPVALGTTAGVTIPFVEPQGEGLTYDGADHLILVSERGDAARGTITRLRIVVPSGPKGRQTH
jgi:hypothetical protein